MKIKNEKKKKKKVNFYPHMSQISICTPCIWNNIEIILVRVVDDKIIKNASLIVGKHCQSALVVLQTFKKIKRWLVYILATK